MMSGYQINSHRYPFNISSLHFGHFILSLYHSLINKTMLFMLVSIILTIQTSSPSLRETLPATLVPAWFTAEITRTLNRTRHFPPLFLNQSLSSVTITIGSLPITRHRAKFFGLTIHSKSPSKLLLPSLRFR